jgi:hypothetical protein
MLTIVSNAPSQQAPVSKAAAKRIASNVAGLEAAIDQAMAFAAALTTDIVETRQKSGLAVHTGQLALIRLQRAQAQLVAASNDTFRAHDELSRLAKTLMIWEDPTEASGLLDDDQALDAVA